MSDESGALPPGLALAWGVQQVGRRGPKPALSVERIVATGIELGDQHGFEAISLQRIAGSFGVTTNAMYRYVRSKEELLVLVTDAAWGQPPPSILTAGGWREGARAWVRAQIDRYADRPWLLDLPIRGAPITPNLLRWVELLLQVMAETGLNQHDTLGCAVLFDGYARSHANLVRQIGASDNVPVQSPAVGEFLMPRLQAGDYPRLAAMMADQEYEDGVDDDLEFGLDRILDGIQVLIDRR